MKGGVVRIRKVRSIKAGALMVGLGLLVAGDGSRAPKDAAATGASDAGAQPVADGSAGGAAYVRGRDRGICARRRRHNAADDGACRAVGGARSGWNAVVCASVRHATPRERRRGGRTFLPGRQHAVRRANRLASTEAHRRFQTAVADVFPHVLDSTGFRGRSDDTERRHVHELQFDGGPRCAHRSSTRVARAGRKRRQGRARLQGSARRGRSGAAAGRAARSRAIPELRGVRPSLPGALLDECSNRRC
jgi:hypothetical protein